MDNSVFFRAFKRAGMLVECVYKPGTPQETPFSAQWKQPDTLLLGDEAQATEYLLEFQTADVPHLRRGDPLTVAGAAYSVREPARALADGYFSTVALTKG